MSSKHLTLYLIVAYLHLAGAGIAFAQSGSYTKTQVTTGAFDHKWPSINNRGDITWSQQVGGLWQVFIRASGTSNPVQITNSSQNHERPVIADNGDIVYFKDQAGGGVGYQVVRLSGGTESILEFSSRNNITGDQRVAGKNFGIAPSTGTTISYFDFVHAGLGVRRFNVSGLGTLRCSGSNCDFSGFDFPDINEERVIVYSDDFTVDPPSIYMGTTGSPFGPVVAVGHFPHIADGLNPELVYVSGAGQVVSTAGGQIDTGIWADVNNAGTIVYEKAVGGFSQVFLATIGVNTLTAVSPTSQSALVGTQLALTVMVRDDANGPVSGTEIAFSITSQPTGAGGTLNASAGSCNTPTNCTVVTGGDGKASAELTVGSMTGPYQIATSCPRNDCAPAVTLTVVGAINVTLTSTTLTANVCSPVPFLVTATDPFGNPWPKPIQVSFSLLSPPGSIGAGLSTLGGTTGADGILSNQLAVGDLNGPYQITASCPNLDCIPNATIVTIRATELLTVSMLDPVPDLVDASGVITDPSMLSAKGRIVQGIAADGVARVVLRIAGTCVSGEELSLTLSSGPTDQYGSLGTPGSGAMATSFALSADTSGTGMAFATYQAPNDFARPGGADDSESSRTVNLHISSTTNPTANPVDTPILIVRPPVVLVHGTWSHRDTWFHFPPFNPLSPDPRFDVFSVDYSGTEVDGVIVSAASVLFQIANNTQRFKTERFKMPFNVAAVQSDLVAHSLGGLISRALAITPGFARNDNFQTGDIHKLIAIDSTHQGTPLATNLVRSNFACKTLFRIGGRPIGQQIVDQAEKSAVLLKLNAPGTPPHITAHALVGLADPIQVADAEDAPATEAIEIACPSLLPGGSFRQLYTTPSNPTGENDIIVDMSSQAATFSGLIGRIPVTTFQSLIHAVSSISPQGPDVLNRQLDNNAKVDATPTVPTVAEVVRLLNSSDSADFAPIKP